MTSLDQANAKDILVILGEIKGPCLEWGTTLQVCLERGYCSEVCLERGWGYKPCLELCLNCVCNGVRGLNTCTRFMGQCPLEAYNHPTKVQFYNQTCCIRNYSISKPVTCLHLPILKQH